MASPDTASDLIRAFNQRREPERLAMKYKNMRANAFVFLRGTAHLFHQRYAEADLDRSFPGAWCCNDMHLENFGSYLGDNGLTYFDLNDLDEACLAPADWDLVRLAASVLVAALSLGIAKPKAAAAVKSAIAVYVREVELGKPRWLERRTATGPVGALMDALRERDATAFLDKRTVIDKKSGARLLAIDEKKMLSLEDRPATIAGLRAFFDKLALDGHPKTFFRVIDAARRVAGTGSLGLTRFVVLVEGNGSPDKNVLLDLKAAAPSAAASYSPYRQPDWADDAERVVALQSRVQAVTPAFLRAVKFQKRPFILKMLQPTSDRLDLATLAKSDTDFQLAVNDMAALAAWAHLRSTGRQGSATADDLIAATGKNGFAGSVFERAQVMTKIVEADFKQYAATYDGGGFTNTTA